MLKILIVEDQPEKAEDISSFLNDYFLNKTEIVIEESLRSGLMQVVTDDLIDLIILDMSMPNFTVGLDEVADSEPVSFAGAQLMKQMEIRGICIRTIVLTQYSIFEKGSVTLKDLDASFKKEYPSFYLGSSFYSSSSPEWRDEIKKLLDSVKNEINSDCR
jgi:CheY-like chemotaxis protein